MKVKSNYSSFLCCFQLCLLGALQSSIAHANLQRPINGGPLDSRAYFQIKSITLDGKTSQTIGPYFKKLIKKKTVWTREEAVVILDGGWINPSCQVKRYGEGPVESKEAYKRWITNIAKNASRRNKWGWWVRVNYVVEPSLVRSLFECTDANVMKDSFDQLAYALTALNEARNAAAYLPLDRKYHELGATNSPNHDGLKAFLREWFAYYTDFKDFNPGSPVKLAAGLFSALEYHGNRLVGIVPNTGEPDILTRLTDQLACDNFRWQAPWNAGEIRCLVHGNFWGLTYVPDLFERYFNQERSAARIDKRRGTDKKKKKKRRR